MVFWEVSLSKMKIISNFIFYKKMTINSSVETIDMGEFSLDLDKDSNNKARVLWEN